MAEQPQNHTQAPHELTPHAPVHHNLLGNLAVRSLDEQAEAFAHDHDDLFLASDVARGLGHARDVIFTIPDGADQKLSRTLVRDGMPVWLQRAVNADKSKNTLLDAAAAPDATFANVLQWHNANQVKKNNTFERETVAPMRERYLKRLDDAVAKGWISADLVSENIRERIAGVPVGIADGVGFDETLNPSAPTTAYSHNNHDGTASYVRHTHDKPMSEATFTHEMTHEITGHSADQPSFKNLFGAETEPQTHRTPAGPLSGFGLHRLRNRESTLEEYSRGLGLLTEATTEHFTQALLKGDIDTVRPLSGGAYKSGLLLLKTLCEDGAVPISPRHFVNAMLACNREQPSEYDAAKARAVIASLKDALKQAFPGVDAIQEVANMNSFGITGSISLKEIQAVRKKLRQGSVAQTKIAA